MQLSYETVRGVLERYQDSNNIYDWADGYGEPGYSIDIRADAETPVVVLGDYWCRCGKVLEDDPRNPGETRPALHAITDHHPRVWAQMEAQGVALEWSDEWVVSYGGASSLAYRTQGDSYSWQSSILWGDGDFLTPEDGLDAWVEQVVNDSDRCLSSHVWTRGDLAGAGFVQWEPGDPHTYESGWHPGQTDEPAGILESIREQLGDDVEVIFYLDSVGQFDARFSAWTRGEAASDD